MTSKRELERRADELDAGFDPYRDRADCWRAFLEGEIDMEDYHRLVGVSP